MKHLKKYNENKDDLSYDDIDELMVDLYDMFGDYSIYQSGNVSYTERSKAIYEIKFKSNIKINRYDPNDKYLEFIGYLNDLKKRLNDLGFDLRFHIDNNSHGDNIIDLKIILL